jgi:hypothetical protein
MDDEDSDYRQSADDALEPKDDIFVPKNESRLPNDYGTPAAPADDIHSSVPLDSPSTDDGIDSDELYQEGISGATNADDEEVDPNEEPRALDSYDQS